MELKNKLMGMKPMMMKKKMVGKMVSKKPKKFNMGKSKANALAVALQSAGMKK